MAPTPPPNRTDKHKDKPSRRALQRNVQELQRQNHDLQEKIRALRRQLGRQLPHDREPAAVQRPTGSAGDGFNLREEMGLADNGELYRAIQRTVRMLVGNAGLDHRVVWRRQPREVVAKLFRVARKRQPYLRRFVNDWATEEFVKQYLKNRRAYCKRMGYTEGDGSEPDDDHDDGMHHIDDEDNGGGSDPQEEDDRGEGPSGTSHDDD